MVLVKMRCNVLLLRRRSSPTLLRRALSASATEQDAPSQVVSLARLAHRARVQLRLSDRVRTKVEVVPVLAAADCELRAFGTGGGAFTVAMDVDSGSSDDDANAPATAVRVTRDAAVDDDSSSSESRLQLFLPPLVSLDLALAVGDVDLRDKLEGDVKVVVGDGDIRAHKLRGDVVSLKTNRGAIDVAALVEGESVKLAASSVACKRLMAASAEVKIGKSPVGEGAASEFGAIYSPACVVTSLARGSLHVGSVHGYLRVGGDEMQSVHVDSVNGALDVEDSGKHCAAVVHFDSLALDASSSVLVGGDVSVSVEPSAAIEVELHGSAIATDGCAFAESELEQLDADYAIFSGALQATQAAASPSASSGKINVSSAKSAAMRTSFFMSGETEGERGRQQLPHPAQLPRLLVHATSGTVRLEQLDWMAKLKRKHLKQQT